MTSFINDHNSSHNNRQQEGMASGKEQNINPAKTNYKVKCDHCYYAEKVSNSQVYDKLK